MIDRRSRIAEVTFRDITPDDSAARTIFSEIFALGAITLSYTASYSTCRKIPLSYVNYVPSQRASGVNTFTSNADT
jgi:hypothetical protein